MVKPHLTMFETHTNLLEKIYEKLDKITICHKIITMNSKSTTITFVFQSADSGALLNQGRIAPVR